MPTTAAAAINSSFGIMVSRFAVLVVVRNARISSSTPVKKTNPPRAILSRCVNGKYGIASPSFTNAVCLR